MQQASEFVIREKKVPVRHDENCALSKYVPRVGFFGLSCMEKLYVIVALMEDGEQGVSGLETVKIHSSLENQDDLI